LVVTVHQTSQFLEMSMPQSTVSLDFTKEVLPHLDAAYNLARWLTRNETDAQDVVQEAYLRAFRFFVDFRGGNVRAWVLRIVRNTCYSWLHHNRPQHPTVEFDETSFGPDPLAQNPEQALSRNDNRNLVRRALKDLPPRHREVLILRELEGMSYKEISEIIDMPAGTVMSRLARARDGFRQSVMSLEHQASSPHSLRFGAELTGKPTP
jgi:RNA polymerase sigma-70 factor (ECF subfamily)